MQNLIVTIGEAPSELNPEALEFLVKRERSRQLNALHAFKEMVEAKRKKAETKAKPKRKGRPRKDSATKLLAENQQLFKFLEEQGIKL